MSNGTTGDYARDRGTIHSQTSRAIHAPPAGCSLKKPGPKRVVKLRLRRAKRGRQASALAPDGLFPFGGLIGRPFAQTAQPLEGIHSPNDGNARTRPTARRAPNAPQESGFRDGNHGRHRGPQEEDFGP